LYKIIKSSWIKIVEPASPPAPESPAESLTGETAEPSALAMEADAEKKRDKEKETERAAVPEINPQDILDLAAMQAERIESDARTRGEALIRNAQDEARNYLSQAQTESETLKETAFQEGYQEGCRIGKEETSAQLAARMEPDIQQFNVLLHSLSEQQEFFLLSQDIPILEMIMAMAEKILGTAVALKPELIQSIIRNILNTLNETGKILIRVNPVHIPYLNDHGAIFDNIDPERIQIEEDPAIKPGGCHIETEMGFMEIDMDEQMEVLKKALREEAYHAGL
jgi:flagellar assembly protein FliH